MDIKQQEKALVAKMASITKQYDSLEVQLSKVLEIKTGDRPTPDIARLIKTQAFSYGVHFERRKVLRKVKSPGAICVSQRRFATRKEALQHGKRFTKIQKHVGFDVVRTNKKANAWINWVTGKTNPVLNG